ncbi:hypothetical protein WT66_01030 [Burkholderia stagnalis]|nr:hypothetical protein [Burkholderia cenocepacia]KVO61185.1 hypothetical protein WT18_08030 [Burkholderia stagnalis]HDR9260221.1 hypothetical protein [Burkholderia vietnamiensis]KVP12791.1 hypothetical protein WT20_09740 [Burkholderia stagnalis]KVW96299.1 hypothetical protein WT30_10800 [Burkholderia stagnalis]KWH75422.1 hypothetical protein WT66_01030 [Burkholderia stagnalis]
MDLADFHIGLEFVEGPFRWRCTDVGSRTVIAIRLVERDPNWYQGPPYMVEEVVLSEERLGDCHLTVEQHIEAAIVEADTLGHPGYPNDAVRRMREARHKSSDYPHKRIFGFDRVRDDGEIVHPYAAHKAMDDWMVSFYLPFSQDWGEMPESKFITLPIATPADVRQRLDRP